MSNRCHLRPRIGWSGTAITALSCQARTNTYICVFESIPSAMLAEADQDSGGSARSPRANITPHRRVSAPCAPRAIQACPSPLRDPRSSRSAAVRATLRRPSRWSSHRSRASQATAAKPVLRRGSGTRVIRPVAPTDRACRCGRCRFCESSRTRPDARPRGRAK
jgi:hypothetical protein